MSSWEVDLVHTLSLKYRMIQLRNDGESAKWHKTYSVLNCSAVNWPKYARVYVISREHTYTGIFGGLSNYVFIGKRAVVLHEYPHIAIDLVIF